ncbi:MAG: AAA family ATPase [Deltaproteobacteria bacterium]|nr:AAA family ATPase [Deltaproteobacteria bacterium]MBI3390446.1 AAA family ATPase [Deltaproteobacteria bacterium]
MALSSESNRDQSGVSGASAPLPFINRREQLDWLHGRLQETLTGRPQVVEVVGEAGIGKTRFVQHAQAVAAPYGVQVYYGRCYEELALPYVPFVEGVLSHLPEVLGDLDRALGPDAEVIRRLIERAPTIGGGTSSVAPPTEHDKQRLFSAVARAVLTVARAGPTVLVLDDLHWADRPSLDLLSHVVFSVADAAEREAVPLMIVGAHRPVDPTAYLTGVLASLQREPAYHTLVLPGFDEPELAELIHALHLGRPATQFVTTVAEATQGNPLFAQAAIRHLVQQGALCERGGELVAAVAAPELHFPEHVTGAIAAHIQGLSDRCHHALTVAAFLASGFTLESLHALSGLDDGEVRDVIEEAQLHGLLRAEGARFQFAHPLIQHVFSREPSAAQRQMIHNQVADVLESTRDSDGDAYVFEIAHHLIAAGAAAEAPKVVAHARRAGDRAFATYAWGDAARYYQGALAAAESIEHSSLAERAELHYRTAYSGHRDRNPDLCLDHYDRAIAAYRAVGDARGVAQTFADRTRAQFELIPVAYGTLIDVQPLEQALEALGESEPVLRGRIWSTLADVYWTARQPDKARELSERALAIGLAIPDAQLCGYARQALGLTQMQTLHLHGSLDYYEQALLDTRTANDVWLEANARSRVPLLLTWLGRLDEAHARATDAGAFSRKIQDWTGCSLAATALSSVALARGAFDDVETYAAHAMLMLDRSHYPWGGLLFLPALAGARALRAEWDAAADAIDILVEPDRVFPDPGASVQFIAWVYRQLLALYAHRLTDADATSFARTVVDLLRDAAPDINTIVCLCAVVEVADAVNTPSFVEPIEGILRAAAESGALFCNGWPFLIPRLCGVAAASHRKWEDAEVHFQLALQAATAANAQPELGRACLDYARMLAARGTNADRQRASELLHHAASIFADREMIPFSQRAGELAAALPTSLPAPTPRDSNQLTKREIDVLARLSHDRRDDEIAAEMLLSPVSVASRVRSILQKTGSADRAAAAAYARSRGLATPIRKPANATEPAYRSLPPTQPRVIMFTDMEDYTPLIQRLGDRKAQAVMRTHNAIIRECLAKHGGTEIKHTGDGVNAWFQSARAALACAVAIQSDFAASNGAQPQHAIRVRVGLNAGNPIAEEGQLYGASVNAAARICAGAEAGQILVSDVVRQLAGDTRFTFRDCGSVALKGFSDRFQLYAVTWEV